MTSQILHKVHTILSSKKDSFTLKGEVDLEFVSFDGFNVYVFHKTHYIYRTKRLSMLFFSYSYEIMGSSFNFFLNLSDFSHIDLYFESKMLGSVEPGNYILGSCEGD